MAADVGRVVDDVGGTDSTPASPLGTRNNMVDHALIVSRNFGSPLSAGLGSARGSPRVSENGTVGGRGGSVFSVDSLISGPEIGMGSGQRVTRKRSRDDAPVSSGDLSGAYSGLGQRSEEEAWDGMKSMDHEVGERPSKWLRRNEWEREGEGEGADRSMRSDGLAISEEDPEEGNGKNDASNSMRLWRTSAVGEGQSLTSPTEEWNQAIWKKKPTAGLRRSSHVAIAPKIALESTPALTRDFAGGGEADANGKAGKRISKTGGYKSNSKRKRLKFGEEPLLPALPCPQPSPQQQQRTRAVLPSAQQPKQQAGSNPTWTTTPSWVSTTPSLSQMLIDAQQSVKVAPAPSMLSDVQQNVSKILPILGGGGDGSGGGGGGGQMGALAGGRLGRRRSSVYVVTEKGAEKRVYPCVSGWSHFSLGVVGGPDEFCQSVCLHAVHIVIQLCVFCFSCSHFVTIDLIRGINFITIRGITILGSRLMMEIAAIEVSLSGDGSPIMTCMPFECFH